MKTALLQITSSDDPQHNLEMVSAMVRDAADQGAGFILTPEVTNCVSLDRRHQASVLSPASQDPMHAAMTQLAQETGAHILIGSLAVKPDGGDDPRFLNRSLLINPQGDTIGQYDKIHMFDVAITAQETFRESAGYRPGTQAVVADTPFARIGMAVCYDMRFPLLANALVTAGATVLTYPSAFSPVTGAAHWHSLLRARAIEAGAWVLAPAQTGTHPSQTGKVRHTYGHALAIDPWGEVILDAGQDPGIYIFDLEMDRVAKAGKRIPARDNARPFDGP